MRYLGFIAGLYLLTEIVTVSLLIMLLGVLPTVIIFMIFFMIGVFMLRRQSIKRQQSSAMPAFNIFTMVYASDRWRYSMAALLFILPGIFNNLIALVLLAAATTRSGFRGNGRQRQNTSGKDIIDGEYRELD